MRRAAGLTQAELASRSGVSRQLIGAVEAGKHLPRVDAAVAIAAALDTDVASLFSEGSQPVVVTGAEPEDGELVRAGLVGDRIVTAPIRMGPDGWDVADGIIENGDLIPFGSKAPGLVVAGCEPGLEALERILRETGSGAVSVSASSQAAVDALRAGRVHAAVVHGPSPDALPDLDLGLVDRFVLAKWNVGLASSADTPGRDWWNEALSGRIPVVQREEGAGVQRSFQAAVTSDPGHIAGPRVSTHLEAARRAALTNMPAVTIEPAALAVGAEFYSLEVHEAQLWVAQEWRGASLVTDALQVLASSRFQQLLGSVGGYDLTNCGARAA